MIWSQSLTLPEIADKCAGNLAVVTGIAVAVRFFSGLFVAEKTNSSFL